MIYMSVSADRDVAAYTEAINLMNYSAVVIPVTTADKAVDVPDPSFVPLGAEDTRNWEACKLLTKCLGECACPKSCAYFCWTIDDAEIYDGGPVGLQLVARKFEEEKILAIAKIVHAALQAAKAKAGVV